MVLAGVPLGMVRAGSGQLACGNAVAKRLNHRGFDIRQHLLAFLLVELGQHVSHHDLEIMDIAHKGLRVLACSVVVFDLWHAGARNPSCSLLFAREAHRCIIDRGRKAKNMNTIKVPACRDHRIGEEAGD
jgi:hypothetical protein